MKLLLIIMVFMSVVNAKMNFYTLSTTSEFLMELPSKTIKKVELKSQYGLGVNSEIYNFDFNGLIFKNNNMRINIANLKVYALKSDKLYKVKVQKYTATTKVNLNNKFVGEFQWSSIRELNSGLTQLTKKFNAKK